MNRKDLHTLICCFIIKKILISLKKFVKERIDIFSIALQLGKENTKSDDKLYKNRAVSYANLNKINEALDDCNKAIELDNTLDKSGNFQENNKS